MSLTASSMTQNKQIYSMKQLVPETHHPICIYFKDVNLDYLWNWCDKLPAFDTKFCQELCYVYFFLIYYPQEQFEMTEKQPR